MKTHTMSNGQTLVSLLARPFVVRSKGRCRYFGSYEKALEVADDDAQIFFDTVAGHGHLIR